MTDTTEERHERSRRLRGGSVAVAASVADIGAIFDDEVNVVVHERALPACVEEQATEILGRAPETFAQAIAPGPSARAELAAHFGGAEALADDVAFWIELLADLTGSELVGVRLAILDAPMCPRLHVDRVLVRVVCTYVGAGTEYVASDLVDRRFLGHAANGASDEVSGLLLPGAAIRRAASGDVVLLKGEAWPGNGGRGAVHRSPAASAPRLVVTLDPL